MEDLQRGDERDGDRRVRRARPLDGPAIAAVHVAAIRELGATAYDDEQVDAWAAGIDPEEYPIGAADGAYVVVAEEDGEIVGFGCLEPAEGEVTAVYVHPDVGGEGVGSAILAELEAAGRKAGHGTVTLTASKNAVSFYERHGFERVEPTEHRTTRGVVLECIRMEKALDRE